MNMNTSKHVIEGDINCLKLNKDNYYSFSHNSLVLNICNEFPKILIDFGSGRRKLGYYTKSTPPAVVMECFM